MFLKPGSHLPRDRQPSLSVCLPLSLLSLSFSLLLSPSDERLKGFHLKKSRNTSGSISSCTLSEVIVLFAVLAFTYAGPLLEGGKVIFFFFGSRN